MRVWTEGSRETAFCRAGRVQPIEILVHSLCPLQHVVLENDLDLKRRLHRLEEKFIGKQTGSDFVVCRMSPPGQRNSELENNEIAALLLIHERVSETNE